MAKALYFIFLFSLFFSASLGAQVSASSAEQKHLTFGVLESPPLVQRTPEDFLQGFYIDLLREYAKLHNHSIDFAVTRSTSMLEKLETGQFDLLIGFNPEQYPQTQWVFSKESLVTHWAEVFTHISRSGKIYSLPDLDKRSIGLVQQTNASTNLKNLCNSFQIRCNIKQYPSNEALLKALEQGIVAAIVLDTLEAQTYQNQQILHSTGIVFAPRNKYLMGLKGRSEALLQNLDIQLAAWKTQADSHYETARQTWLQTPQAAPVSPLSATPLSAIKQPLLTDRVRWGLMIAGFFILLGTLLLWRNSKQGMRMLRLERDVLQRNESRFRNLLENIPYGLQDIDLNGQILFANSSYYKQITIFEAIKEAEEQRRVQQYLKVLSIEQPEHPDPIYTTLKCRRKSGCAVRMEWSYKYDEQDQLTGFFVLVTDVTGVGETKKRIRDYHIQLKKVADERKADLMDAYNDLLITAAVFENTSEAIMVIDLEACLTSINPAFESMTGFNKEQTLGQPLSMMASKKHDASIYPRLWEKLLNQQCWQGEVWNQRANGSIYPGWLSINVVLNSDEEVTQYVALLSDITKRKQYEKQIWRQANYDALTQLPNRNLFHRRLEQAISRVRQDKHQAALMFIDLDHFKEVNDTLGHDAGDELLKAATRRIVDAVRKNDTVARMGGDEFTVILPIVEKPDIAIQIAKKILEGLNQSFTLNQGEVNISGSIGIVICPKDGEDLTTLLKNADIAMYKIKEHGRNGYYLYQKES
ncbi:diguanylate cyclase [Candidatus Venteria ishoeyi]|uniref:diguanylate cyclase domain-containing protein n=1 Tax=Candidatus Venteria ishoeyi TaxID=1899563 RepID=UPI0025A50BAB|nr:diguanylate cyclase [Candidatus Venteria ishoeyi]MDM8546529.1 diguanylate cyclase [Candidatus Venteria ishoeyi]